MLQAKNVFVLAVSYFVDRSMKARLEIDILDYCVVIIFCGSFIFTLILVVFGYFYNVHSKIPILSAYYMGSDYTVIGQ